MVYQGEEAGWLKSRHRLDGERLLRTLRHREPRRRADLPIRGTTTLTLFYRGFDKISVGHSISLEKVYLPFFCRLTMRKDHDPGLDEVLVAS
jgi:hypothetical protein